MRARCQRCRATWRLWHMHHGRKLAHVGKASIFGEIAYHVAHVMGAHHVVTLAAGALVFFALARVLSGEL